MKTKVYVLTVALALFATTITRAQSQFINRVIVLNEGHFDYGTLTQTVPVTVGDYDPSTGIYKAFDTIKNARFASCVIVDGSNIYVGADSFLIRYDKNTYQKLAQTVVYGIRKIAVWKSQLLVTRGDYSSLNSYFQSYDKNSLKPIYKITPAEGLKYSTENIIVVGDSAYISINNGFQYGAYVGYIGVVDLSNQVFVRTVDLGTDATNPDNLMYDGKSFYTLNNTDFTKSTISTYTVSTGNINTALISAGSSCQTSSLYATDIMYQVYGSSNLGRFSTSTSSVLDSIQIGKAIYGMAADPLFGNIYVSVTDYLSSGKVYEYDQKGNLIDSFAVSVSPGNITFDVENVSGIANSPSAEQNIFLYPNPVSDNLNVTFENYKNQNALLKITDITGKEVYSSQISISQDQKVIVPMQNLTAGMYLLSVTSDAGSKAFKIIKQ